MAAEIYEGDVAYQDGWHYAVGEDNQLGERLVLEDTADGSESRYRLANDADTASWHDRKHGQFVQINMEDGTPGVTVTAEEMQAVQEFLDQRRADG
jgi:hypothetical protein